MRYFLRILGIICGRGTGPLSLVRYLEQERTIILAVVPANQDVATVDILERAKIVSHLWRKGFYILGRVYRDLVGVSLSCSPCDYTINERNYRE